MSSKSKPTRADDSGLQIIKREEFSDDEDDDFQYERVDDNFLDDEDEDDELTEALASMQTRNRNQSPTSQINQSVTMTQIRPSVVDDFIRNFMIKAGMKRSLETFNSEWYELQSKGKLSPDLATPVPDIYLRNEDLDQQAKALREQVENMRVVATKAQSTWDKFRKERDFHRMHHKRVVQEKNKLISDLRRLRDHLRAYEPTIEELRRKHDTSLKDKALLKLERDRLKLKVKQLEEDVNNIQNPPKQEPSKSPKSRSATRAVRKHAAFPAEQTETNPYANLEFDPAKAEELSSQKSMKGHLNSISACAFHPKKPIFATASDDETWRLWTLPECELVMSGEGHTGWLSGLHFHPYGSHLATSAGDGTVKIWEFAQARCTHTFKEHSQAVWGCEFHYAGDFVASCSMDQTIKVWDLISGKCRQTLRGHVDSVNATKWLPFSSNICSASGDKTVSVWDARSGLCVQTLYGHSNSCNDICVNNRGDTIATCDADGVVKVWDIRMVQELGTIEADQHPINKLTMDRSGSRVIAASDDGTLKVINTQEFSVMAELPAHDKAVQCVQFSPNDSYVVSGSSDATFKVWA